MGWSLDILNVFILPFDTSICEFFMCDVVFAMAELSSSLPVPVQSAHILQSCHLLIGQIGDDLQHTSTIAIETKDILVEEGSPPCNLLEVERSKSEATDDPLGVLSVLPEKLFHYYFNLIIELISNIIKYNLKCLEIAF